MNDNQSVAVLGFGAMGGGIAQVCAQSGRNVLVLDTTEERVAAGRATVEKFLQEGVNRGKVSGEDKEEILSRIEGVTDTSDLAGVSLVIEAVAEDLRVKTSLLPEVAEIVGEQALIATNTSALPVTDLAASVPASERFAGLHFFNPAQLMPLVEVIGAEQSSEATLDGLTQFAKSIGKEPIRAKDRPGFLVNRLLMPYLNQVIEAYDDGLASAEDIDAALELGLGYPVGGIKLLDQIGLDVHLHATSAAYEQTHEPSFSPPPLLSRMVSAGYLGRKTGRGFYDWREGS